MKKENRSNKQTGVEFGLPFVIATVNHAKLAFLEVAKGKLANTAGHTSCAFLSWNKALEYFPPDVCELINDYCHENFGKLTWGLEALLMENWDEAHLYFKEAVIGFRICIDGGSPELLSDWPKEAKKYL